MEYGKQLKRRVKYKVEKKEKPRNNKEVTWSRLMSMK
jgi:hypothetical protein